MTRGRWCWRRGGLRAGLGLWLAALGVASGAAWTPIEGTEHSYDYVDLDSLRVDGSLRRVWTLHDLTRPDADGDLSYRSLLEYHCTEGRYRSLQNLFFSGAMATGRLTGRSAQPGAWRAVQQASVGASIMQVVCTRP